MRCSVLLVATLLMPFGLVSQTASKANNKPARKNVSRKPGAKAASRSKGVSASPPHQAAPSSDRYKEIQEALTSKGYIKSSPTGVWDAESVDAMKRYQTDRKLDPSGKVTARSLISLGLGPKDESPPNSPPANPLNPSK